ncbi:MAG: hypothetical protein QW779_01790 [Nitrososphaerales archaeon]
MTRYLKCFLIILIITLQYLSIINSIAATEDVIFADAVWGSPTSPIEVAPGDKSVILSVILLNNGYDTIKGIIGTLYLPRGFTSATIPSENVVTSAYDSDVAPGKSFILKFLMNIAPNASVSRYYADLDVNYTRRSGANFLIKIKINFRVTGKSIISAFIDNPLLKPGTNNDITLYIQNDGTAIASKLDITLSLPSGLTSPLTFVDSDGHWTINELNVNSKIPIKFTLYASISAANQAYELPLTITYHNSYGNIQTITRKLGVRVDKPEVEDIVIKADLQNTTLIPGSDNDLIISIHNSGNVDAKKLDITLSLPSGLTSPLTFVKGDGHWVLDNLNAGTKEYLTATIHVSVSAANNVYQLPLTIKYEDRYGNSKTIVRNLGVRVTAFEAEKISINALLLNQVLTPGVGNQITLILKNNGSKTAYNLDVTLTLPEQVATPTGVVAIPFAFSDTDGHWFINSLPPKGEVHISFKIFVAISAANNVYQLPLTITYRDEYGNPQSSLRKLGLRVSSIEIQDIFFETYFENSVLSPGSSNNVTLILHNKGKEAAYSIDVKLNLPIGVTPPLAFVGSDGHWMINIIKPGERVSIKFGLYASISAANTAQQLTLTLSYQDKDGNTRTAVKYLGVTIAPTLVKTSMEILASGYITAGIINKLNISLINKATKPLTNMTVSISSQLPSVTLLGAQKWYFPNLDRIETLSIPIYVNPEMAGTAINLLITTQYIDEKNVIRIESENLGIYVQGLIKISIHDISLSYIGKAPMITGSILNEGNTKALFTRISLLTPPTSPIKPISSTYIGDLDPDTSLPFSLAVDIINPSIEGEYPITIIVNYKDSLRVERSEKFEMSVIITPLQEKIEQKPSYIIPIPTIPIISTIPIEIIIFSIIVIIIVISTLIIARRRTKEEEITA